MGLPLCQATGTALHTSGTTASLMKPPVVLAVKNKRNSILKELGTHDFLNAFSIRKVDVREGLSFREHIRFVCFYDGPFRGSHHNGLSALFGY